MSSELTHEQLLAKIASLESELNAQCEFISIIAHQLKTPLTGTKWSYRMLLDGEFAELNSEQKSVVQEGYKNNERMIALVDELRAAGKSRVWNFIYHPAPTDIETLIHDVMSEFLALAKSKHIPITVSVEGTAQLLLIDASKIRIVIENMLDNALKYTPEDSDHDITIHLVFTQETVTVSMHNAGATTTAEENEHIFKKFTRGSHAKKSHIGGTGLGLFTVERIVRDHGGTVTFTSDETSGTTVSFTLPFAGILKTG